MHPVIPVKRLASMKMKLLCAAAICLLILLVTTASVSSGNGSLEKTKLGQFNSQNTDANLDVAHISSLRLVHVFFRHGDRTPIDRFPLDPYNSRKYWPEGWGKLTTLGKQMQYHLGQSIRKRYDGFLSKVYTAEEIYVQCSDKDRTIQSAMAQLTGMWPSVIDNDLNVQEDAVQQYVPVHAISPSVDNKIAFTKPCPMYDKLFGELPLRESEREYEKKHEDLYKYLSEHTGLKITSYYNVSDIYDILNVQRSHNFTLPTWTHSVFPDVMLPLAERWLLAHVVTEKLLRLRAGPLVTDIVRNMKRVAEKPSEDELKILETLFHTPAAKYYAYSGHDSTVHPLLTVLGAFQNKYPPYASSLYFELHESSSNDYYVKVFYRPEYQKPPFEVPLKKCKSNPCTLTDFINSVEPYILDEKQWELECQL